MSPATSRQYDDFELQVRPVTTGAYEACVLRAPGGEVRSLFTFPLTADELGLQIHRLETLASGRAGHDVDAAKVFGGMLFVTVFAKNVLAVYDQSISAAQDRSRDLRICLRVFDDPLLSSVPWELLYDVRRQRFVALQPDTLLVRMPANGQPFRQRILEPPLRVLAMAAQPVDLVPIDVHRERQHLESAFERLGDDIDLQWAGDSTWRGLQEALQRKEYQIFHFIGHGLFDRAKSAGYVVFADENGKADLRTAEEVCRLLGDQNSLQLVVLNACDGAKGGSTIDASIAMQLVNSGIPSVIAMQHAVDDEQAVELTRGFYGAVSNGLSIDAAFGEARKALSLAAPEQITWSVPVLVTRSVPDDGTAFRETEKSIALPRWSIALMLILLLLIALLAGATAWPQLAATFGPVRMPPGSFNIAVAPFAASTPPSAADIGKLQTEGRRRADMLASSVNAYSEEFRDIAGTRTVAWGPESRIQQVGPSSAAGYLADIRADLLLFGEIELVDGRWNLKPRFVLGDPYGTLIPELVGEFALGSPLDYGTTAADSAEVTDTLRERVLAFAAISHGYSSLMSGSDVGEQRALELFEWLDENSDWISGRSLNGRGQEVLYLFMGLAYLQLAHRAAPADIDAAHAYLAHAQSYVERGLAVNPDYARLLMARANIQYQQAANFASPACDQTWRKDALALDGAYQAALDRVDGDAMVGANTARHLMEMFGHLGLARIDLWRFRCTSLNPDIAQLAVDEYRQVIAAYERLARSLPDGAARYSQAAILASGEMAWVMLFDASARSLRGQPSEPLDEVIRLWEQATDLAKQSGDPSLPAQVDAQIEDACGQLKQLNNLALEFPAKFADFCR